MAATKRTATAEDVTRAALASDAEPQAQRAWVEDAADCFRRYGVIAIRDAIPKAAIEAVLKDFQKRYDVQMAPGQTELYRRYQTDPLRAQLPVAIDGPVANPEFFAPPSAAALVRELLGEDVVIGEMGVVITHPGAASQESHRDSYMLFGGIDVDAAMPPFAMNLLVPLVDVAAHEGPTEYWPGSHRTCDEAAATAAPPTPIALEAGTVLLHDMRVLHRGSAKPSGPVRPLVYISYHRRWHQETNGYDHKPQLIVTPSMLERLPEAYRKLFVWALHLNRRSTLEEFAHRWIGRLKRRLQKKAA
jgi:ectoine hydroxylase-related dioxygenase (phytanoyl-CoA dioxygenase family)